MTGLSSVMAITRPLGEVDLAHMNRCAGVYRVYLVGGGGGGGGYYALGPVYGDPGFRGQLVPHVQKIVPPVSLVIGQGGGNSINGVTDGGQGGQTVIADNRGISITAYGGGGGLAAVAANNSSQKVGTPMYGKITDRFSVEFSTGSLQPPWFAVSMGSGGPSNSTGNPGGIIKAFRIG